MRTSTIVLIVALCATLAPAPNTPSGLAQWVPAITIFAAWVLYRLLGKIADQQASL